MAVFKILKYPHVLLRKKATPVENFTPDLKDFSAAMIATMEAFEGIGLAAPQVGISKRIFVIDVRPYFENDDLKDWHGKVTLKVNGKEAPLTFPLTLINPEIVRREEEVEFPYDGCLSFPGLDRGVTKRSRFIELHAKDAAGNQLVIESDGIMSICVQHEMDHLDGILFIDRLRNSMNEKVIVEEIKEFEADPAQKKFLKKLAPVDAREQKYAFL